MATTKENSNELKLPGLAGLVECCVAQDSTQYAINGVAVSRKNGVSRAVATDGRRAMIVERDDAGPDFAQVIVPNGILEKFVDDKEVVLHCDGSKIVVSAGGTTRTGEVVEGKFPNVDAVVPDSIHATVRIGFNARLLRKMLDAMGEFTVEGARGVCFEFTDGTRPVKMACVTPEGIRVTSVLMPLDIPESLYGGDGTVKRRVERSTRLELESLVTEGNEPAAAIAKELMQAYGMTPEKEGYYDEEGCDAK